MEAHLRWRPLRFLESLRRFAKVVDLSYSIGIKVRDDEGTVIDVAIGGPAFKAGVGPSVKLIAVDNRQYSSTLLREAIQAAAKSSKPIELLIKAGDFYKVYRVDYHGVSAIHTWSATNRNRICWRRSLRPWWPDSGVLVASMPCAICLPAG